MISGTYVLTDSIDQAFEKIFTEIRAGRTPSSPASRPFDIRRGERRRRADVHESLLEEVRRLPGVAEAEGSVDSETDAADRRGRGRDPVVYGGAPNLGFSIAEPESPFNPLTSIEGGWPGPNEVVVDKETAEQGGLRGRRHDRRAGRGSGRAAPDLRDHPVQLGPARSAARRWPASTCHGAAADGEGGPARRDRGRGEVGRHDARAHRADREILRPTAQVRTGLVQAEEDAAETNEFIAFLQAFLLAFGGIALFVGSFVIANSLSITIAQRTRELATLRMLGASRRQVLGSIVVEALVVGIVASVIGLFSASSSRKASSGSSSCRLHAPEHGSRLPHADAVLVALFAGILVTLLASLRPAIRATRVPPIAAVREGATIPAARFSRLRGAGALLMTGSASRRLSTASSPAASTRTQVLIWMGLGTLLVFLGVALFSSQARPAARAGARLAGRADRRGGGVARTGQRPPQPAAHGLDGRGADDRARARHARRDARRRDHRVVRGRGQRHLRRRLRDHRSEQLLADPDRGRGCARRRLRRHRGRERADGRGADLGDVAVRDCGRPGRPR